MNPTARPFYVIGHNTNTIDEVQEALACGANAIEPDVNIYDESPDELCISHLEGSPEAPSLQQFLTELHEIVNQNSRLALVVFDCKAGAATPEFGLRLLLAIRKWLSQGTDLNIIISVSEMDHAPIFDKIKNLLGPREGLMIDEHKDPQLIAGFFMEQQVKNACYGNGISIPPISLTGPNVMPSMEKACALRAATGRIGFICVWTVNQKSLQDEFVRVGVDGIICDDVKDFVQKLDSVPFRDMIRLAERIDNPFQPENKTYGLTVFTADQSMAGTDALITFTLTGSKGSAEVCVDSSYRARMERDHVNSVTLHSEDLGELISVTVQSDFSGHAPGWCLEKIIVESFRYAVRKTAIFNKEIGDQEPMTVLLGD